MTIEEAKQVISIMLTVDNGCPTCAKYLCQSFARTFPLHSIIAEEMYTSEFDTN